MQLLLMLKHHSQKMEYHHCKQIEFHSLHQYSKEKPKPNGKNGQDNIIAGNKLLFDLPLFIAALYPTTQIPNKIFKENNWIKKYCISHIFFCFKFFKIFSFTLFFSCDVGIIFVNELTIFFF